MLVGPNGFQLLHRTPTIELLGEVGMLYIMFLSGIEIDMADFRRNSGKSLLFGALTFIFPAALAFVLGRWVFHYSWLSSVLLGAMLGSHTLMTYPIVSRYNVQRNQAVNIVVGGTIVAITLSLLVLAAVGDVHHGASGMLVWLTKIGKMVLFVLVVLYLFPLVAKQFFKHVNDPLLEFLLVLIMLFGAALLAQAVGLEGILGAFLAGVALNRLIPNLSPLMNRLNFMGNSLLIPLFLISVGMLIDVRAFWSSWSILTIAVAICLSKLVGKGLATILARRIFHFNAHQAELVFALTQASAAGTLAIVSIGYQMGLLDQNLLQASVLMILILCTSASFLTEHAAKLLATAELQSSSDDLPAEHVMVSVSTSRTEDGLVDFAILASEPHTPLSAVAVIRNDDEWHVAQRLLDHAESHASASEVRLQTYIQVAANIVNGLSEVIELKHITRLILGAGSYEHSDVILPLVNCVSREVSIYRQTQPLSTIQRLRVAVPVYAEKELSFKRWFEQLYRLAQQTGSEVVFYTNEQTRHYLSAMSRRKTTRLSAEYVEMQDWEDMLMIAKDMRTDDMLVLVQARHSTASYNPLFEQTPHLLDKFFSEYNTMVVFPEQTTDSADASIYLSDIPQSSESFSLITKVKNGLLDLLRRHQQSV